MKRIITSILFLLMTVFGVAAQHLVSGTVLDETGVPLPYANVFIKETLEGGSTGEDGRFSFQTDTTGQVTLSVLMLGYENWSRTAGLDTFSNITIRMKPASVALDNVEVVASNFTLKGSSEWQQMGAVDIVTAGGSNGDLYRSITTLPGTQMAGENGRLYIRGGESREAQTYIDDMHVLLPYTSTGTENTPVRGRYSPFMFEGMNFSLGGYDPEYGQGLSSVLPLTTKDESLISKYGVSFSSVGAGGGGTKSCETGSASLNLDYQNLGPYYSLIPDRTDWIHPYQKFSGGTQLRYNPDSRMVAKLYAGYDRTSLAADEGARRMYFDEDNYYVNGTFRHQTARGYRLFAGGAFSLVNQEVEGARVTGDHSSDRQWELHLKMKMDKRFSSFFRMLAGMEVMTRRLDQHYTLEHTHTDALTHSIHAAFATGTFSLSPLWAVSLSSRLEYTTVNDDLHLLPRLTVTYNPDNFSLSAIVGRYSQLTYNDYLLADPALPSENCWHYILGAFHQSNGRVYRFEVYDKEYDGLACLADGRLHTGGYGYSRGVDLFFNDRTLIPNLEYRLSYSLNFAKRLYRDNPVYDVPQYATRHNASISLRYEVSTLRSIIGLTNRYASGRPYHDPNEPGWMNRQAPAYNSLDLSWTILVNKKCIIFASATNILGRKQIYNYAWSDTPASNGRYRGAPVLANADNFFFVGCFITLGGNAAYDVSNF